MTRLAHPAMPMAKGIKLPLAILSTVFLSLSLAGSALAEDMDQDRSNDSWLPSLITETPQKGFSLAVTLSQKGVAPLSLMSTCAKLYATLTHTIPIV